MEDLHKKITIDEWITNKKKHNHFILTFKIYFFSLFFFDKNNTKGNGDNTIKVQ